MIRFVGISSEYTEVPKHVNANARFCTYAWIETDEIKSEKFPVAVIDHKTRRYRGPLVFAEPIWRFIEEERTPEQQKFIDRNIDKLNSIYQTFMENK